MVGLGQEKTSKRYLLFKSQAYFYSIQGLILVYLYRIVLPKFHVPAPIITSEPISRCFRNPVS